MAQRNLADLYSRFCGRTDALLRDFLVVVPAPLTTFGKTPAINIVANNRRFLVNRLFHLWGEFCRLAVIESALGGCRTLSGSILGSAPNISRVSDIPPIISQPSISGPRLRWGDPTWTTKQVNTLMLANRSQIILGVTSAPYDTWRRVRNFVIHPNPHTRAEFDTVAFRFSLIGAEPEDVLITRLPGGGTVMESWIQDFNIAAMNVIW